MIEIESKLRHQHISGTTAEPTHSTAEHPNTPAIIGGAVGGPVVVVIAIAILVIVYKKRTLNNDTGKMFLSFISN